MKRKLTALLLAASMIASMIPAVGAASSTPDEFYNQVGLELLPARSEGLYDEPVHPQPDVDESGFIREIEGWTPGPVGSGLPVAVTEAEAGAVKIATAEDLQAIRTGGSYVLTADIDLSDFVWKPQNISGSLTLDGQGHTIRGLALILDTPGNNGMFAQVSGGLTVKNLRLEDISITTAMTANGNYSMGSLAGWVSGKVTLENVAASGVTLTRTTSVAPPFAGIIGHVGGDLSVTDCAIEVSIGHADDQEGVYAEGSCARLAGLTYAVDGKNTIQRLYAKVNIDGKDVYGVDIGGLLGIGGVTTIQNSWIESTVSGTNNNIGGVIGFADNNNKVELNNCMVMSDVTGSGNLGGVMGRIKRGAASLTDCRYQGTVALENGAVRVGGLVGYLDWSSIETTGCAVDAKFLTPGQDQATATLKTDVGGVAGYYYRSGFNVTSCDIRADFDDFVACSGSVGGIAGSGSGFSTRDTSVEFSGKDLFLLNGMNLGGFVGYADGTGTIVNSGANIDVNMNFATGYSFNAGGLVGRANSVQAARSYASGSIDLDGSEVAEGTPSGSLGGMVGFGGTTFTQCYGGTDIRLRWTSGADITMGGIAAGADTIISCWSDAVVESCSTLGDQSRSAYGIGGLVGSGGTLVLDSCFVGELPNTCSYNAGGLIGLGGGTVRNCYAETNLGKSKYVGGLVGRNTGVGNFYDCWFKGDVTDAECAGGIVGSTSGSIYRCDAQGTVTAPGNTAGGIAGSAAVIEDCAFNGTVGGLGIGGIVGGGNEVYDSTFRGSMKIMMVNGGNSNIGGIASKAFRVENCHVLDVLSLYLDADNVASTYQYAGGIVGRQQSEVTLMDCTTKGLVFHSTSSTPPYPAYIGGLAPGWGMAVTAENCKVDGDVVFVGRMSHLRIGGLMGRGGAVLKNCMVTGDVAASISPLKEDGPLEGMSTDVCYIGGLVGEGSGVKIDASYHSGSVRSSTTHSGYTFIRDDPLVGNNDYEKVNMPGAPERTRDDENYIIYTYGHELNSQAMLPLAGVAVSIDGNAVGITDNHGTLTLSGEMVDDRSMVKISAVCEGYFESSTVDFLCQGGSVHLILKKKEEGKIYLTSALIETDDEEMQEMLYSKNSVNILLNDERAQHFYFGVDWNDTQTTGRKLSLVDKDDNVRVDLTDNVDTYFQLVRFFEPEEEIYLKATGLKEDGSETVTQTKLPLKVKLFTPQISMVTEEISMGDHDGKRGIDALAGVKLGLDFGNLFDGIGKLTYANHVLTAEFGGKHFESPKSKLLGTQVKAGIKGVLSLTDADKDTPIGDRQWSGGVHVFVDLDPALSYAPVSVPGKPPFPFTFYTEVKAGGDFGVDVYGTLNKPRIGGALTVNFDANITAGLGGSADRDWLLVVGGRLGGEGKYTGSLSVGQEDLTKDGYGEVALYVDVALIGKGGEMMDLDASYQVGRIQWDSKNGATIYALGNDVSQLPGLGEDSSGTGAGGGFSGGGGAGSGGSSGGGRSLIWMPTTQSYLTSGGGFQGGLTNVAILKEWRDTPVIDSEQSNVAQLYENIVQGSTGALTVENGNLVLYFTADDGNRELDGNVADHTALWRTVCTDETWSDPMMVSGSENGYPDDVQADGPAAVWVESTKTGSLEELLTSTRIKVALNGEVFHTIETGGYVYGAKVSAAEDGSNILVSWFSAPEVNSFETMLSAEPVLCYARYADGAWSQGTVKTGDAVPASATPIYNDPCIVWTDIEGQHYHSTRTDFYSLTARMSDLARAAHNGSYTAEMEADGRLVIWNGTSTVAELQTGSAGFEAPLLLDDGNGVYYAIWAESDGIYYADSTSGWAYAKPICALEQQIMGLSGAIVDGLPVVTYYQTDYNEDKTDFIYHLYTAKAPDLSGMDLAVTEVTLDDDAVGETGLMTVSAEMVNLREGVVTGYVYTVTDETGKEYFTGAISDVSLGYEDTDLCHALIAVHVSAQHTYTVTVTAEGDVDGGNNVGSVTAQSEAELASAAFSLMPSGEIGLKAVASNAGGAPLEEMAVAVYRCNSDGTLIGDVLAEESFVDVLPGSYRQLMLDEAVMDTLYKVVLTSGGEEVDSQMLMWSDPEVSGAWITGVDISEDGQAKVKLSAQNWTEDLVLHLAVYQDGRMVANEMETLSAWSGSKSLDFDFAEELKGGAYTYSAILLKQEGLVPMVKKISGNVSIP